MMRGRRNGAGRIAVRDEPAAWIAHPEPMRHFPVEELQRVVEDLSLLGLPRDRICQASGVPMQVPESPLGRIGVDAFVRVFACAEHLADDVHVGLHAAEQTTLNHLVGFVAASQPTLGHGLAQLCRFQALLFGGEGLSVRAGRTTTRLVLHGTDGDDRARHVTEYYIAALARECVALAGPRARPLEVRFCHAPVGSIADYERVFGCAVRFRAEDAMLCLSRDAADAPLASANAHVARLLGQLATEQLDRLRRQSLRDRVADAIRASMANTGQASCARIGRQLAMSVRTLQRRLGEEGLTFRSLRDAVRRDLAIELTGADAAGGGSSPTITDLAMSVGFSDSATLCRAFKRWTGMSPGMYRGGRPAPMNIAPPEPGAAA